ncbi:hypothetical protein JCM9534A_35500 [Catenuloplanes indicus JCM 9534]
MATDCAPAAPAIGSLISRWLTWYVIAITHPETYASRRPAANRVTVEVRVIGGLPSRPSRCCPAPAAADAEPIHPGLYPANVAASTGSGAAGSGAVTKPGEQIGRGVGGTGAGGRAGVVRARLLRPRRCRAAAAGGDQAGDAECGAGLV